MQHGFSLRETFSKVARSMNQLRGKSPTYVAFTIARVLNNGQATIFSYDAPPAILVGNSRASVLERKTDLIEQAEVGQSTCFLRVGEGLLVFSDGVSQAGLGLGMGSGWGADGVCQFVNEQLKAGSPRTKLPGIINDQARSYWANTRGDDSSIIFGLCTTGLVLDILTGPCSSPERDEAVVKEFLSSQGLKIICGASTAKMVARCTNSQLSIKQDDQSLIAPPKYEIPGFDLVCEGTVTLNQVYNIFDVPRDKKEERSAVTELVDFLHIADRVNFKVGLAENPACSDISFRQQGIHPRRQIVDMLSEKLRQAGKLVVQEFV